MRSLAFDFYTGKIYKGGQSFASAAPIDIILLYIREGSIIPMCENIEFATEKPGDKIELRIYPSANGEFMYYEDENDNYNYEKGKSKTFKLTYINRIHWAREIGLNGPLRVGDNGPPMLVVIS